MSERRDRARVELVWRRRGPVSRQSGRAADGVAICSDGGCLPRLGLLVREPRREERLECARRLHLRPPSVRLARARRLTSYQLGHRPQVPVCDEGLACRATLDNKGITRSDVDTLAVPVDQGADQRRYAAYAEFRITAIRWTAELCALSACCCW